METEKTGPDPAHQETARFRSGVYFLLARVFRKEPDAELIRLGRDPKFQEALSELGAPLDQDFLTALEESLIEDLSVEFTRLFIGPGKHISTQESVYANQNGGTTGMLWGDSTVDVVRFIRSVGLNMMDDLYEIPEHISVELELMDLLTDREARAWEENNKEETLNCLKLEKQFFEGHLVYWMPEFCNQVMEEAESSFYRSMARATAAFIELEGEKISSLIEETKDASA